MEEMRPKQATGFENTSHAHGKVRTGPFETI